MENQFWEALDKLIEQSEIIIDRPRGSRHPRYPHIIYEVDYGYLKNTLSGDKSGIDVWRGSDESCLLDAVMVTVDLMKRDSEIKLLINCTEEQKQLIHRFHNESVYMKGLLIRR